MTKRKPDPKDEEAAEVFDPVAEVTEMVAAAVGEDPRAMVYVSRKDPKDGQERHLQTYTPDSFDIDQVRQDYGGGQYRARIKGADGAYRKGSKTFRIEGEPRQGPPPEPEPVASAVLSSPVLEKVLVAAVPALIRLLDRPPPAPATPVDPVALATALAGAQAQGAAQLAEIVGLKKDLAPASDPEASVQRFMEALQMGMEIGRESAGDGDGMGALAGAVSKIVDMANSRAASAPGLPPGQAPPPPPPQAPSPPQTVDPLRQVLGILLPAAVNGSGNPEAWAAIAEESVPGSLDAVVGAVASAGGVGPFIEMVATADPRVATHREFFEAAAAWFVEGLDEPEEGEGDDSGERFTRGDGGGQ